MIFRTLDDATINGIDYYPGDFAGAVFDVSSIEKIDWKAMGTNVKLEFNKPGSNDGISIQESLESILVSNNSFQYIVYDHGSGEIADYVTVTDNGNEIIVALYHVKKMGAANFNSSVGDIYEVCGQAVKSITWFSSKANLIDKLSSRHNADHCVLVKGKYEDMIRDLKGSGKLLRGEIVVVQPSISKSVEMPEKFQEVLAATSSFIKRAGKVNAFRIMGSP